MSHSVTVRDIARHANVSNGTVSRVLNNQPRVSADLRKRVLRSATELGYVLNGGNHRSSSPIEPRTSDIGYLLFGPEAEKDSQPLNSFWSAILTGAQREAERASTRVLYHCFDSRVTTGDSVLTKIVELRLNGALIVNTPKPAIVRALEAVKLPLVLVDDVIHGLQLDAVISDNFGGARTAVECLLDHGHRDIALLGDAPGVIYTIEWRAQGYRYALQHAGIPVREALMVPCEPRVEHGYLACRELLRRGVPFSAIFCANDAIAIGAMRALHEAGKSVPADVSIVGFDDDMAEHCIPALTTMRVHKETMGAIAMNKLLAQIDHPTTLATTTVVSVTLIERGSVRKLT